MSFAASLRFRSSEMPPDVTEHSKVERLEATVASLAATVKEQAAQIQRVSAKFEGSKRAPQMVLNNR